MAQSFSRPLTLSCNSARVSRKDASPNCTLWILWRYEKEHIPEPGHIEARNALLIAAGTMIFHSRRRKYEPRLSTSTTILIWFCGSVSCWPHCSCKACYDKWCSYTAEYQQSSSVYSQMSCIWKTQTLLQAKSEWLGYNPFVSHASSSFLPTTLPSKSDKDWKNMGVNLWSCLVFLVI